MCTHISVLKIAMLEHMGSLAIPQSDTLLTLFTYLSVFPPKTSQKKFTYQKTCETVGEAVPYQRLLPAISLVVA